MRRSNYAIWPPTPCVGQRTQEVGNYRFVNLPLGAYSLSVSKPGFENQVFNNVTVQAAQTTDLKAILNGRGPNANG